MDIIDLSQARKRLALRRIFNTWDPLMLFPYAKTNVYDCEINEILKRLPSIQSVGHLASIIEEVFCTYIDEYSILPDCEDVAQKVWQVMMTNGNTNGNTYA